MTEPTATAHCHQPLLGDRYASMYSAIEDGSGIDKPSSRMPSRCIRIASRIRSSTSICVAPVATQPGKSGENADRLFGVFSMTMRYLVCIVLVLESGLPKDAIERTGSDIVLQMSCDCDAPRFRWVFVLTMAALLGNHHRSVSLDYTLNFSNSHRSPILRLHNG